MTIVEIAHRLDSDIRLDLNVDFRTRLIGFHCRWRKRRLWRRLPWKIRGGCRTANRTAYRGTVSSRTVSSRTVSSRTVSQPAGTATRITNGRLTRDDRGVPRFTDHPVGGVRHLTRLTLVGRAGLHACGCATGTRITRRHGPIRGNRDVAILGAIAGLRYIPATLLRLVAGGRTGTAGRTIADRHRNRLCHRHRFIACPKTIPATHHPIVPPVRGTGKKRLIGRAVRRGDHRVARACCTRHRGRCSCSCSIVCRDRLIAGQTLCFAYRCGANQKAHDQQRCYDNFFHLVFHHSSSTPKANESNAPKVPAAQ